jgi:soluble lytic murein transglycosylase-like protein
MRPSIAGNCHSVNQFVTEPAQLAGMRHKVDEVPHDKAAIPKNGAVMIRKICVATLVATMAALGSSAFAKHLHAKHLRVAQITAQVVAHVETHSDLDTLIARHAAANNVPEDLVRRIIKRESRGNPRVVSAGNYGLMQIKLPTARSMGYTGSAAGLLDADTNMTYAVKYLAGAYQVAGGNPNLAVHYYAAGYYYAAKGKRRLAQAEPHGPVSADISR